MQATISVAKDMMRSWHVTENHVSRHANAQSMATRLRLDFSRLNMALRQRLVSTAEGSGHPMQGLLIPATLGKTEAICDGLVPSGHLDRFTGDSAWASQELPSFPDDPACVKDYTDIADISQRSSCLRRVLFPATYCKFEACAQNRSLLLDNRYTDDMTIHSGADIDSHPEG